MGRYDHRKHAGNAGDVWKHFLLLEAADWLFSSEGGLVYLESHAGRPEYLLSAPGDLDGGIVSIWPRLPDLTDFSYFNILKGLNREDLPIAFSSHFPEGQQAAMSSSASISRPASRPIIYPGSTRLIYELARRKHASLRADVWDNDAGVADAWNRFSNSVWPACSSEPNPIAFHLGDGFAGVMSILSRSPPGLLFIDPPYIDPQDARLAEELLQMAIDRGWIVMWWYMMDMKTAPDGLQIFELLFSEAGLDGGRWTGAAVALAGTRDERLDDLTRHLHRRKKALIRILKLD